MQLGRLRIDRRTFAKLLKIVDDHKGSALQTAFDHPAIAVLRPERHGVHMNLIIAVDRKDLLLALKLGDCGLWNQHRIVPNLSLGSHPAKLARTKHVTRIREGGSNPKRSSLN